MTERLDAIEREYERAIAATTDTNHAHELSIALRQYREAYKVDPMEAS